MSSGDRSAIAKEEAAISRAEHRSVIPLYIGFSATGVGVALPGAVLPVLLHRWHLSDSQGGLFFLLAWIGSSFGALAVNRSLRTCLCVGMMVIGVASIGLGSPFGSITLADSWMALYGTGLGLTMTSITLIQQINSSRSGTELIRLNLFWAAGAFVCPALAIPAMRSGSPAAIFVPLGSSFIALAFWCMISVHLKHKAHDQRTVGFSVRRIPLPLIGIVVLITGVEASAGAWLATYASRLGRSLPGVVAAPTCLWAGLLLSRLFWSTWDRLVQPLVLVRGSALVMLSSTILLTPEHARSALPIAAFLLGFGTGPIYPLALDWVLSFNQSGAIFFLAGVGSATLPWLTGITSQSAHSLRAGLYVPVWAAASICLLTWLAPIKRKRVSST